MAKGIWQMRTTRFFDLNWPLKPLIAYAVSFYINYFAYSLHIFCIKCQKSLCTKIWQVPDFYLGLGELFKRVKRRAHGNNCNAKTMHVERIC